MTTYYTGNLPQSTSIVTELNSTHTYVLPPSWTMCFPFIMKVNYYQVVIDMANTTPFESAIVPGMRAWPSAEPVGQSITSSPYSSQSSINIQPNGNTWNFWMIDLHNQPLIAAAINHQILGKTTYWMNIKNLQNKENFFFCRFTYHGSGRTIVE